MLLSDIFIEEGEPAILVNILPSLQKLIDEGKCSFTTQTAYDGESAALDLYHGREIVYYIPRESERSVENKILIPTGIRISVPKGYVGLIFERGSIVKTRLKLRAGVIDPGYTGEVFVNAVALEEDVVIKPGEKLPFQLVVIPCNTFFHLTSNEDYESITSNDNRKEGQIGSSN